MNTTFKQGFKNGRGVAKGFMRWVNGDSENGPRQNVAVTSPSTATIMVEWQCTMEFARGIQQGIKFVLGG